MDIADRAPTEPGTRWGDIRAEDIGPGVDAAIREADALVADAVALPDDAPFDAVFGRLDRAGRVIARAYGRFALPERVHPDPAVREAATAAGPAIEGWRHGLSARDDVAGVVRRFAAQRAELDEERGALLDRWLLDVQEAGHGLGDDDRQRLADLRRVELEAPARFFPALGRPHSIDVSDDELAGVPDNLLALLGGPAGADSAETRSVVLTDPVVNAVLEGAPSRALRERAARGNLRKGYPETTQVLDEVAVARRAIARLLGEPSWMALRASRLAIGGVDAVERFIEDVEPALSRRTSAELEAMRRLLAEETGDPDVVVEEWDWRYLDARQRAREGVDPTLVRDYLPFEAVLAGLWRLSDEVFGVRVDPRPERAAWHPDVRAFDMVDATSGDLIAQLYVDPFARPGKAGSAWADILDPGDDGSTGAPTRPRVMLLGTNAPAPGERPSTLGFVEIDMVFHEYGHVLDFALDPSPWWPIREDWSEFDWVEAASTFLGRWGQHPDVMRTFARRATSGEPMPDELFAALARLESINTGLKAMRYLSMGRLDMLLHGADPIPALEADRQAWPLRGIPYVDDTSFVGTFLHMVAGYSAATYGFLWDIALRDDLFAGFGPDLLSADSGARYRRAILEAPWTRPPVERMAAFLGRPWSSAALLERSGA